MSHSMQFTKGCLRRMLEDIILAAAVQVPHPCRCVPTPSGQILSIRAEGDTGDTICMALQVRWTTIFRWAPSHTKVFMNYISVNIWPVHHTRQNWSNLKTCNLRPLVQVPYPCRFVGIPSGQVLPIRAEGNTGDTICITLRVRYTSPQITRSKHILRYHAYYTLHMILSLT